MLGGFDQDDNARRDEDPALTAAIQASLQAQQEEEEFQRILRESERDARPAPTPTPVIAKPAAKLPAKPAAKPAPKRKSESESDDEEIDDDIRAAIEASLATPKVDERAIRQPAKRHMKGANTDEAPKPSRRQTPRNEKKDEEEEKPLRRTRSQAVKQPEVKPEAPKPSAPQVKPAKSAEKKVAFVDDYEDDEDALLEAIRQSEQEAPKPAPKAAPKQTNAERRVQTQVDRAFENVHTVLAAIGVDADLIEGLKDVVAEFREQAKTTGSVNLEQMNPEDFLGTFLDLQEENQAAIKKLFETMVCQGEDTPVQKMNLFLRAVADPLQAIEDNAEALSTEKKVEEKTVAPAPVVEKQDTAKAVTTTVTTVPVVVPTPAVVANITTDDSKTQEEIERLHARIQRIFALDKKDASSEELNALLKQATKFDEHASKSDILKNMKEQFDLITKGFDSRKDKSQSFKDFLESKKPAPPITPMMLGNLARERKEREDAAKKSPVPVTTPDVATTKVKKEDKKDDDKKRVQPPRSVNRKK